MKRNWIRATMLLSAATVLATTSRTLAQNPHRDFGAFVEAQLSDHAEELFGFRRPLERSALGPYDGADNLQAIEVAAGLRVSLISNVTASAADQIALWPNDDRPTHLFVCDEETSNPSVQRIDLSRPAGANATTIVTGLSSCDPVRRTIYKFVPTIPFAGGGPIAVPAQSPLVSGTIYGLRVGASGSSNWGQGAETGAGAWTPVNLAGANVVDANGNVILRTAQALQRLTGYYRPEDMDVDPIAAAKGQFRACWANTGRKSHNDSSLVENGAVESEVMCLVENPPSAAVPAPPTGTIPTVERFITGSEDRAMYDNVAFQPHTGNLVVLEDGAVDTVTSLSPLKSELRGNDLWICLPDGSDGDALSDGCVRFASIRDTTAEPTGFIFLGSGEEAFLNIQHRAYNDAIDKGHRGALVKISGFRIPGRDGDRN